MKKNKIYIILSFLLLLNSCVSQNFNMSQGDKNKNQSAHDEESDMNNQNKVSDKEDKKKSNNERIRNSKDDEIENENDSVESSESSAYLGTDIEPFAQLYYSDSDDLANMGGDHYKNFFSIYNNSGDEYCSFNIKSQYKKLEGKIGNIDGSHQYNFRIDIIGDNEKLESYFISSAELPTDISVDVSGVKNLKFEIGDGSDSKYPYYIGFADMKLTN